MNTKTPTPTPWVMQDCDNVSLYEILSEKSGQSIADCAYRFADERKEEWKPLAKANAAFIVRAVNAHEEMLQTLKNIRDGKRCLGTDENNDTCGVTFTCGPCLQARKLSAVIARAEGK